MSKELDYITELERKNRLLGERCNQLLKDKGDLTDQIADIKANCDLAIEGRDVKIMELEQELTVEKDLLQEETNLHLHAEDYIKSLEKENEELRNNGFTVSAMTEQQLKVAIEKGEQLEKENAELKKKIGIYQKGMYDEIEKRDKKLTKAIEIIRTFLNMPMPNNEEVFADVGMFLTKAEQFLKEIEK